MKSIFAIIGTRPEAIKLAPLVIASRSMQDQVKISLVSTGQHRELIDRALEPFGLVPDAKFDAMSEASSLASLTSAILRDMHGLFGSSTIDWVVVQGDTTTAMAASLAAFYRGIPVAHVEAGLRTYNLAAPFPEEANRAIISQLASRHFAPTARSRDNLLRGGISPENISVTGNTVVDAVRIISEQGIVPVESEIPKELEAELRSRKFVLVTCHRREAFGEGIRSICSALLALAQEHPDIVFVFPVHLNPNVLGPTHQMLAKEPRIKLMPPLSYSSLMFLMKNCFCILSDSGGIQEEAASFRKPILILREETERPEIVEAGFGILVGTDTTRIVKETSRLLTDEGLYVSRCHGGNPFGDGRSSERILDCLSKSASNSRRA